MNTRPTSNPSAWTVVMTAIALLVAACAGPGEPAAPTTTTPAPRVTSSTTTPPPTTLRAPTTEPVATTQQQPDLLLLAYGDSFASLNGWPSIYGEMAAAALGRSVEVGGVSCSLGCSSILGVIEQENQRDLIEEATIIVLQPYPGRVFAAPFNKFLSGDCGGDDGAECIAAALADFDLYLADLLDTVTLLADSSAVVRVIPTGTWALDYFYPDVRTDDPAKFEIMVTALLDFAGMIAAATAARCIGVADANAILSGPDYRTPIDPLHSHDGAHPSREASQLIAADLHALGYEPTASGC